MTDFNLVLSQVRQRLEILYQIVDELEAQGGGGGQGGTDNYNDLSNKPKINNITLSGNKTGEDLGLADYAALADKADKSTTYTKTEVDTALSAKANAATTYTKTETDAAITSEITGAINDLDVTPVGGSTKYLTTISEANGLIDAAAETPDATPTTSSTKLITSGGVKSYVDTGVQDAKDDWFKLGTQISAPTAHSNNLNNYKTPGHYYIPTNIAASNTDNTPVNYAGKLNVELISNSENYIRQTYFANTDSTALISVRRYKGIDPDTQQEMWSEWATFSSQAYVDSAVSDKITMTNILGAGQRITATSESSLSFDNAPFTSVGRFNWLSSSTQYITNCPSYINNEAKGGLLETSYIQGGTTILQTVYPSAGADSPYIFWQRFRYGSPGTWTPWYAFTGTQVQTPSAQTTNLGGEMRSVASLEESDIEPIEEPQEER